MRRLGLLATATALAVSALASARAFSRITNLTLSESIVSVTQATIVRRMLLVGTVLPKDRLIVTPETSGRVKRIFVNRGEHVSRGEPLLEFDGTRFTRDVTRREIALERALLRLSQQISLNQSAALERLDVRQAELDLEEAKSASDAAVLRSPMDAVVVQMTVNKGDVMSAGMGGGASAIVLASSKEYVVEVEADEFEAAAISRGLRALISSDITGDIVVEANVLEAPVLRRPRGGSSASALFTFTVAPKQALPGAYFGMSARVEVDVARQERVAAVPLNAITRRNENNLVVVVDGAGASRPVRVELGLSDDFMVQLLKGPPIGTRVRIGDEATLRSHLPLQ